MFKAKLDFLKHEKVAVLSHRRFQVDWLQKLLLLVFVRVKFLESETEFWLTWDEAEKLYSVKDYMEWRYSDSTRPAWMDALGKADLPRLQDDLWMEKRLTHPPFSYRHFYSILLSTCSIWKVISLFPTVLSADPELSYKINISLRDKQVNILLYECFVI
jgi:hypothetical protein